MRRVLPLLVVTCLAFAPAPDKGKGDLERIQGNWLLTGQYIGGRSWGSGEASRVQVVGRKLKYLSGGKPLAEYALALDASARPKRFTFKAEGDSTPWRGVYELDGRSLTICYDAGGGDYPASLDDAGRHVYREVYRREKP